jgi:hypothetical protein
VLRGWRQRLRSPSAALHASPWPGPRHPETGAGRAGIVLAGRRSNRIDGPEMSRRHRRQPGNSDKRSTGRWAGKRPHQGIWGVPHGPRGDGGCRAPDKTPAGPGKINRGGGLGNVAFDQFHEAGRTRRPDPSERLHRFHSMGSEFLPRWRGGAAARAAAGGWVSDFAPSRFLLAPFLTGRPAARMVGPWKRDRPYISPPAGRGRRPP